MFLPERTMTVLAKTGERERGREARMSWHMFTSALRRQRQVGGSLCELRVRPLFHSARVSGHGNIENFTAIENQGFIAGPADKSNYAHLSPPYRSA